VVPASRARLRVLFGNAEHAMLGLDGFSHVWVLFVFHDNGNRAVKALVHPPRLDGDRMGVFATRSPHRPNPIGLSLCKVRPVLASSRAARTSSICYTTRTALVRILAHNHTKRYEKASMPQDTAQSPF
jgi:tRNA (Thr-GGU) A37 N-methylase